MGIGVSAPSHGSWQAPGDFKQNLRSQSSWRVQEVELSRVRYVHEKGQNPTRSQIGRILQEHFKAAIKDAYAKLQERKQKETADDKTLDDMFLDFGDAD